MAWIDIGEKAALVEGSTTRAWAHFQYDSDSTGNSRSCRIVIEPRSGHSFNVMFRNIYVGGVYQGTVTGVTQNYTGADSQHPAVWTGSVNAGNVTASWENPWNAGTKYPSITGTLPPGGSAPTGGAITYNSCTWNSVNITSSVTSWGGLTGNFEAIVVTGSSNGDAANATPSSWAIGRKIYRKSSVSSSTLSHTVDASDSNVDAAYNTPISIKGLLHYKLAYWNWNSVDRVDGLDNTLRYLPPAPGQFSYTEQGSGAKTYTVSYVGSTANNHSTYDAAELTRTVRYKIGSGQWTYVTQAVTATDTVTTFTVIVPAGQMATVEAWETYHGMGGETQTITLVNTNSPVSLYGSVNNETKLLGPIYGSVNGRTKKLVKIYASVGGVTKKVYEDV